MALVLWSGGCDSTLVLYDLLRNNTPAVRALGISHPQIANSDMGKRSRELLTKDLKARGLGAFERLELSLQCSGDADANGGIIQPLFWLSLAAPYLKDKEDLYAGWIRGDDVWHHKEDVQGVFGWSQKMMNKTGSLCTPLEWFAKEDVLADLKKAGLLKNTWHCEAPTPKGKPCNRCASCKTHQTALFRLEKWGVNL